MSEQNNGEQLLPVCIQEDDIRDFWSALDLYRVLRHKGNDYPAFTAFVDAMNLRRDNLPSPCLDIETGSSNGFDCETFDTFNDAMDFYPNDPFTPLDPDDPNLYLEWARYGDILALAQVPEWLEIVRDTIGLELLGYEANDCILVPNFETDFNPIKRIENLLDQFTSFPFPTVTIKTEGSGTLGVEFLNVPLGGRAIVLRDIDITPQEIYELFTDTFSEGNEGLLNSISLVELNRDLLSIPSETASTQVQEFEFEEEDTNTLRIIFAPAFNDEAPFLFPFGGIRSFRVCGNVSVKSIQSGEIINRHSIRSGVIMSTVDEICAGMVCAMEKVAQRILLAQSSENIGNDVSISKDTGEVNISKKYTAGQSLTASDRDILNAEAYGISNGFIDMLTQIQNWHNGGITEADIIARLGNLYQLDTDNTALVVNQFVTGLASGNFVSSTVQMAEYIYEARGEIAGMAVYAYEETTDFVQDSILSFRNLLTPNQIDTWRVGGRDTPRDDWRNYASTLLEPFEFKFVDADLAATGWMFTSLLEANTPRRLMRVEISGNATNTDGEIFDGLYLYGSNGVPTRKEFTLQDDTSNVNRAVSYPNGFPTPAQKTGDKFIYNFVRPQYANADKFECRNHIDLRNKTWTGTVILKIFDLGDN